MKLAWVVGAGGMVGSALERVLAAEGARLFRTLAPIGWSRPGPLGAQLAAEFERFAAAARGVDEWELYWAAGKGTFRSRPDELATEANALDRLLQCLAEPSPLQAVPGRFAFLSSAGAIYAGSADDVCTERSEPAPTTAYAHAKLAQERLVQERLPPRPGLSTLSARLSTVYGPGQQAGKPQGLISHMARSILRNQPVQLFVPLDTIRDYVWVDDAAADVVERLRRLPPGSAPSMQIVASERPTTISEIVSVFRRIARKPPRIVVTTDPIRSVYSRRLQFRSIVPRRPARPTSIVVGIAELMRTERLQLACRPEPGPPR